MACSEQDVRSGDSVIRTLDGDSGSRPIQPCDNFWSSPDLWVEGGPDRTSAREGVTMTIVARVTNGGKTPYEDINVEAWVCDYTAGPLPTGQLDPPGRVTGFAPGPLNPGQSAVIRCAPTWVPTSTQARTNGGHLCLAANVWAETPTDGAELPAARAILPCCNSHHAQRNIAVVAVSRRVKSMKQSMNLWGMRKHKEQRVLIELFPVTDRKAFGAGELDLLRSSRYGKKLKRWQLGDPKEAKISLEGDGIKGRRGELVLTPRRPQVVTINVTPPPADPGTIFLFDTVTRDGLNHEPLGGARLMVVTV